MGNCMDRGHAEFIRKGTVFLFTSVSLCISVILLATTTVLMADQQETQSASAGTVRNWSDLGLEPVSSVPLGGCEIPLLCEIPQEELERLKAQPYVPPADAGMVQLDMDTSVLGLEPQPLTPAVVSGFEARDNASQPSGFRHRPPDPHLAVGISHIVEMVNTTIVVYNKSGTKLKEASFKNWWGNVYTGSSNPFDPRVAYDHNENRWLMVVLVRETTTPTLSKYLLSISQTSDPTGAWWNWSLEGKLTISSSAGWADYEDLGFDGIPSGSGGAIYLTSNQFTFSANAFQTSAILILPKSSLYGGASFDYWRAWDRTNSSGSQAATLRAAQTFGNPGVEYLVNSGGSTTSVTLWSITPTFPPTAINITRQATVTIGSYAVPPDAVQLGCGSTLDTIGNRIYNAMYRDNALYCAFCEGVDWGGGGGTVAAIRYLKINTATNAVAIDARFGADGFYYWMPAIYTDRFGNIVVVYARSSSTEYAGLWASVRMTTSSGMQTLPQLKGGAQCITGDRWGDYFGAVLDPADNSLVWVCGQWAKVITGGDSIWDWGTWISSIRPREATNRADLIVDFGNFSAGTNVFYNNAAPWTSRHHWGPGAYNMVIGDLDGNGQEDLIVDFGPPWGINVFHNNTGPWTRIHSFSPGSDRMAIGDLDGNGKDDLIVDFGNFNAGINVYYNNAAPWTSVHPFGPGQGRMVTGDLDGNGQEDLIVDFGNFNAGINVYYNNAAPWTSLHPFGPGVGRMVTGDMDGNGKDELIVDFGNFNAGINVYYNNAAPWTSRHPFGPGAHRMVTGDMDGDGKADLIVDFGNFNAGTNVFYNNAAPWTSRHHWGPGSGRMAVGDLDGEGKADL
ncbi:MAG TPA: FG-GAP repeat domain-containing protein, partial [Candidatus Tripitaka californicus]